MPDIQTSKPTSAPPATSSTKEIVGEVLRSLPDDASIEDVMYRLYVRSQIEHALAQEEAGRVVAHEEVEKKMEKWIIR